MMVAWTVFRGNKTDFVVLKSCDTSNVYNKYCASKNVRYCKLIVNEPQFHLAAIYFNSLST